MRNIKKILEEVLEKSNPSKEELDYIKKSVSVFSQIVKSNIKKLRINAELFVGGSFAKGTVIKKDKYDVDIFIRYDKKYKNEELSILTKKILGNVKNVSIIHGSRDYFRINYGENFFIELIPVRKVNNPKEYENITDLSYLHVNYINKKVKSNKILDEIKIAKAFCYANHCYGAESYINGFSGYSLELLVYYYRGFMNFIRAMSKVRKEEKCVIDIEKKFRNKKSVLIDLNSSKLNSPVILIDPTYKQRNALAALSQEVFERFQKVCRDFIKNPSIKAFEIKKVDIDKIKEDALKKRKEFILIEAKTSKPEGDIAGSKLLKFYNYIEKEIGKLYVIKNKGFNYNNKQSARYFFVVEKKKEILFPGPFIKDNKNVQNFKKEHKNIFKKGDRLYAKEKVNLSLKEFVNKWKVKNAHIINEMYINDLKFC